MAESARSPSLATPSAGDDGRGIVQAARTLVTDRDPAVVSGPGIVAEG
ncbi:hypothetical protein ABZ446_30410 [Streptomyces sp. NPDC005813]